MVRSSPEVALFRLENTLAVDAVGHLAAAAATYMPELYEDVADTSSPISRTARVLGLLEAADPAFRDIIMSHIHGHTAEQVAPWVQPVMSSQVGAHARVLALASDFLPNSIVRAYANGLEDLVPGAKIQFTQGNHAATGRERFKGYLRHGSTEVLAQRLESNGYALGMVAAGTKNSREALARSQHPLVVNSVDRIPIDGDRYAAARLDWKAKKPHRVHFAEPGQSHASEYDLSDRSDLQRFTEITTEVL